MTTITASSEGRKARDRKRDGKHRHLWTKLGKEPGSQLMNERSARDKTAKYTHGQGQSRGRKRWRQIPGAERGDSMSVRTEVSASQRGGHRGFEGHILLQLLEEGAGLRLRVSCWRFWNREGKGQSVIVGASSGMDVRGQRKEGRSGGWGSRRRNHYSVLPVRN